MDTVLDKINQNVQDAHKKFQDHKIKEYEKIQKTTSELIGALNNYQSETENTIYREINELRTKINNIKERVTHDMENLRKKKRNRNTKHNGRPSSRIEQSEERISALEDEIEIKGKIQELLLKQLKASERNIQELTNSIKRHKT
jgi:archaellum component FlaC